jgi:hypothetical protein
LSLLNPKTEDEISHNVKIKSFPIAGVQKMTVCNKRIFREPGWELSEEKPFEPKPQNPAGETRPDSVRRAKQKVYELAMLNRFTHFITWTLDKEQIDRYDPAEVSRKLKKHLQNQVQRRNAAYIIIPEHHQDGAIHMHGLLRGDFDFIDSGKVTVKRQKVYNMPQWKYGWSTAIELDGNVLAIARYITKYITKDFRKIFGNFYYAGGDLTREAAATLTDTEYSGIDAAEYSPIATKLCFKYVDLDFDAPCEEYPANQFDIA